MDLKIKHMTWVGNIYRKFEAVCQEVDDIVGQEAGKYFENRVQNVGDSVRKFYSDVQDLLPLPNLVNSTKYKAHSVALNNNIGTTIKSVASVKDNNNISKQGEEENPVNNFTKSLQDSNTNELANDQQAHASIKHELVNQVSDETFSDTLEVEDAYITREEVGGNHSKETAGPKKENLHASTEKIAVKSTSLLMNLISLNEEEPLESSTISKSFPGSSDNGCGISAGAKDNLDVNVEQNSCSSLGKSAKNFDEDTHDIQAEVSHATSTTSCERPMTETETLCFESSLISNSLHSESPASYSFEIADCENNSVDVAWCLSDSSLIHVGCEQTTHVAGQIMESQDELVSYGSSQSMESNDESLVSSIGPSLEDIQLNDDPKLEESCIFVDDSELYVVSCRAQKLRSCKKRIKDAFSSKKRLAKEYEQLAIWYGDTDLEHSQGISQTLLQLSSRTSVDLTLQVRHASETEWELL